MLYEGSIRSIERDTDGLQDEKKCKRMEKVSIRFYNDHELVSTTTQLKLRAADGKRYNNWNNSI